MASVLENVKVVDLTRTLAGPFCTMMLGDMGADVVKIEEPELGDETRGWTPFWNDVSTQFPFVQPEQAQLEPEPQGKGRGGYHTGTGRQGRCGGGKLPYRGPGPSWAWVTKRCGRSIQT